MLFAFSLLRTVGLRESKYAPKRFGPWELIGSAILTKTCPPTLSRTARRIMRHPISHEKPTLREHGQSSDASGTRSIAWNIHCYLDSQGGGLTTHERSTVLPISHH